LLFKQETVRFLSSLLINFFDLNSFLNHIDLYENIDLNAVEMAQSTSTPIEVINLESSSETNRVLFNFLKIHHT
jgi:hypothetical protein